MPSFVREISFEVTTNWESVAKPGVTKRSYEEMLAQGRNIHELKACMPNLSTSSCYRPGDVERLLSRIDQLEAMLGMQTYNVKLPYKFEQSGNGLFGQGRNSLKPVLNGFYGIQFLAGDNKELKARFFLRGANFHPTQTKVICGGSQSDKTTVLVHSRELISVEVSGIDSIVSNGKQGFEVRVGTPDGMSNPQFIPSANAPKSTASGFTFLTNRFDATFSNACCQSRKIALPTDKPVALSFTPTNPFPVDTERSLFCEISASNLSGTEITFGSQAKPFVRSANVVKLAYDPRGFWAVLDPIQFWKEVADALNSNLPNSTNQTFTIKVSAYVGLEKTEVTKTLNSISVVVTPCDCDEQLPSP
jgi:hypothetical protein